MSGGPTVGRLAVTKILSQHQRDWLAGLKKSVQRGDRFAICASDEFEELFMLLGIHTLVVNYWHGIVASSPEAPHFAALLHERGYHAYGLGPLAFASSLDPERAPWGGLPKPTIMLGSTRDEGELRFMELWTKQLDCRFHPLDYNLAAPWKRPPPDRWWELLRSDWAALIDPDQLALRVDQLRRLIEMLSAEVGVAITTEQLAATLTLLNRQIDRWSETLDLIASARRCPVSLRDQIAMYQAMWHRGTERGFDFIDAYYAETAARVAADESAYPREDYRLLFFSGEQEPSFHAYLRERHGGCFVANLYSASVPLYARDFDPTDPLPALCGRNLFLIAYERSGWLLDLVRRFRIDGVIGREPTWPDSPMDGTALAAAGIPYLNVPHLGDDPEQRERLDAFMAQVSARKAAPQRPASDLRLAQNIGPPR